PIALSDDHPLHGELSLRERDVPRLAAAFDGLYRSQVPLRLPNRSYADRFLASVATPALRRVSQCFGGHTLFFIEPDGSVFDCPSSHKIAATLDDRRRSIRDHHAAELFGVDRGTCPADCALGSRDCVNMW